MPANSKWDLIQVFKGENASRIMIQLHANRYYVKWRELFDQI